ncbi:MAG: hypothetical protein OQL20_08015, partial [Sedimenticola sp.]|nr:hypothetical protein [Sedimenticola sp.]
QAPQTEPVSTTLSEQHDEVDSQPAAVVAAATDQDKEPQIPATDADKSQVEAAPKQNEKVQKRLEEMGLMPSDSTEKQAPPPPPPSTGLGFWQKSFIWTIVVIAGLLYFRNVTNNDEAVSPELATSVPQSMTPAEGQPVSETPAATDTSVSSADTEKADPVATPSQQPEQSQSEETAGTVVDTDAATDGTVAAAQPPVDMAKAATAETAEPSVSTAGGDTAIETDASQVSEVMKDDKPATLVEKLTSLVKGADTGEEVADKVMEQGAETATQAIISQETVSASTIMAVAKDNAEALMKEAQQVATGSDNTDTNEGAVNTAAGNSDQKNADVSQDSQAAGSESAVSAETPSAASAVAATTETTSATSVTEAQSETKTNERTQPSSMTGMMSRMMPGFQQNRGMRTAPSESNNSTDNQRGRLAPAPGYNRYGYPMNRPRVENNQMQKRAVPVAPGYPGYNVPRYQQPYNQWPVVPYYRPYTVRPPVYGPAVRYPYPQPVPPAVR